MDHIYQQTNYSWEFTHILCGIKQLNKLFKHQHNLSWWLIPLLPLTLLFDHAWTFLRESNF